MEIVGLDNFDPYYDVALKRARLNELSSASNFTFVHGGELGNAKARLRARVDVTFRAWKE